MKLRLVVAVALLLLLASACGGNAPNEDGANNSTSEAIALNLVTTDTSGPTNTGLPTNTPQPSSTPVSSSKATETSLPTSAPTSTPSPTNTPTPTPTLEVTATPNPWQEVSPETRNEIVQAMPPLFSTTRDVTTDLSQITFVRNGTNINGLDSNGRVILRGTNWTTSEGADGMKWYLRGESSIGTLVPVEFWNQMWDFGDGVEGQITPAGPVWMNIGHLNEPLNFRVWNQGYEPVGQGFANTLEPEEQNLNTLGEIIAAYYLGFGQTILAQEGLNVPMSQMGSQEVPIETSHGTANWITSQGVEVVYENTEPIPGKSGAYYRFDVSDEGKLVVHLALTSTNFLIDDGVDIDNGRVLVNIMDIATLNYIRDNYSIDVYISSSEDLWMLLWQIRTAEDGQTYLAFPVSDVARPR